MAQKLNSQYGFSYDNMKVLLGGWNAWKDQNAQNPSAYPIETSSGGGSTGGATTPITSTVVITP